MEQSEWSKVLSAMTRWASSYAGRYDKEPVKYTLYTQFCTKVHIKTCMCIMATRLSQWYIGGFV